VEVLEGGGENNRVSVIHVIPSIAPVDFKGTGEHKVLLVKTLNAGERISLSKIPARAAPEVISKLIACNSEMVKKALKKSEDTKQRANLRSGEGKYIDQLVVLLKSLFSSEEFEFSSEKIN
jgi:hypothetical protein